MRQSWLLALKFEMRMSNKGNGDKTDMSLNFFFIFCWLQLYEICSCTRSVCSMDCFSIKILRYLLRGWFDNLTEWMSACEDDLLQDWISRKFLRDIQSWIGKAQVWNVHWGQLRLLRVNKDVLELKRIFGIKKDFLALTEILSDHLRLSRFVSDSLALSEASFAKETLCKSRKAF